MDAAAERRSAVIGQEYFRILGWGNATGSYDTADSVSGRWIAGVGSAGESCLRSPAWRPEWPDIRRGDVLNGPGRCVLPDYHKPNPAGRSGMR